MHEPRAMRVRCQRDLLGAMGVDGIETLAAPFKKDADKIDEDRGIAGGGFNRSCIPQIGLHGVDLADTAKRLQIAGEFGPAHRHPDPVVALGKSPHDMAAEKARAAVHGDQGVVRTACGHAALDSFVRMP